MLRSAAKNFKSVTVITHVEDYETVKNEILASGDTQPETLSRDPATGWPRSWRHRNRISCGTASAPLQTNAFCSKRLPSTFADSSVRPYTRKLSSPGHPLPGCCPMPNSKARLRCLSSLASAACRSALEAASKAWLNGFQAVKKALHCVLWRLWAESSSALACPTRRVKPASAKTRYSVSR